MIGQEGFITSTILVVDDEQDIRRLLRESLEMEGYHVLTAASAAEAVNTLSARPELILLDVNMPGMDGFSLCERIRETVECPILFLTARTDKQDQINGLKAGGDDYIIKPFEMEELLARIEAHLRREARRQEARRRYSDGVLIVDFDSHQISREGTEICLTKTEYEIVELLLTHQGQVFDKERIYELVRGYDGEADASIITEHIRRIRRKLGTAAVPENSDLREYIETVWGVGYRWIS